MVKKPVKIAVIGGGSSYTPEIVEGLLDRQQELPVRELWLVDIPEGKEKQDIVTSLSLRMCQARGNPFAIRSTLERRAALDGADFVLSQFRVGLQEARIRDERIPLRHGAIGQETTGAGGMAKALRTIPATLDLCRDMQELCPSAFLINFTNPSGIVTEAVSKHTKVKVVGLCNSPIHMHGWVAEKFGVAPSEVQVEFVGANHLVWGHKVWVQGRDATQETLEFVAGDTTLNAKNIPEHEWPAELIMPLGAMPSPYLKYYYFKNKMLAELLADVEAGKPTRGEVVKQVEQELFRKYQDPELREKPAELSQRGGAMYSEAALRLVASIHNDTGDVQTVDTTNRGAIAELPDDVVVEVNCRITGNGPVPIPCGRLRPQLLGLLQVVKQYEALTIEAAVTGSREAALMALLIHPLVGDIDLARKILDDILRENAAYLPTFR
jgi:6-phospho-beta-glucosidase